MPKEDKKDREYYRRIWLMTDSSSSYYSVNSKLYNTILEMEEKELENDAIDQETGADLYESKLKKNKYGY